MSTVSRVRFINALRMFFFQMETATNCEGSINHAKSNSTLMRRACNSRSDHVCRDYDHHSYSKENSISCSCCRARNNGEDISELQDECSGGDAIDTVPSREREEFVASDADHKNESVKAAERDKFVCLCDLFIYIISISLYRDVYFRKIN